MTSGSDMNEVLITEIQARPPLWNTKLGSYKDKNLRDRLYAEVAEILGISKLLIEAVRNSKFLWDMTDKRYHNRLLVDREWTKIAKELGETIPSSRKRKAKTLQNHTLETRKLDALIRADDDDEDISFFKSLLPHVQKLPSLNKLNFRTQVQNLLVQELTKLQTPPIFQYSNNESHSSTTVSTPLCSPHSSAYNSGQETGSGNYLRYEYLP
ncbi:uncharacterized protein LOC126747048 [Anthonomus grandis grandis]|uniref:uncharacterized protein LOC126747048 n=1 Tax=Anthonomus grandis grandis TaxID=2921223 RepID=UPI00216668C3|nr:uncharacterized protein LOC126747048 [Anthonomus grandis grandis]